MVNESERLIKEKYEKQGYKCLSSGFPDFIFFREEDNGNIISNSIFFCEVKSLSDNIKLNQYKCMEILKALGLNVKLEIVDVINTSTYNHYNTKEANKIYAQIKKLKSEGCRTGEIAIKISKDFDISRASFYRYLKKLKNGKKEIQNS